MSKLFYILITIIILLLLKDIEGQDLSICRDQGEAKERPRRDQGVSTTISAAGAYNRAVFYIQYVLD